MIQGDICWYKFKEPNKERPVLILTRTDLIPLLNAVIVAEITTTSEIMIPNSGWTNRMDWRSDVRLISQIFKRSPNQRSGGTISHLAQDRMNEIREGVEFIFNLRGL